MNPPWKKFGDWTLRTRKERDQAKEEREWASRSGEITVTHLQDNDMTVEEHLGMGKHPRRPRNPRNTENRTK